MMESAFNNISVVDSKFATLLKSLYRTFAVCTMQTGNFTKINSMICSPDKLILGQLTIN